jgi:hypothetical protein
LFSVSDGFSRLLCYFSCLVTVVSFLSTSRLSYLFFGALIPSFLLYHSESVHQQFLKKASLSKLWMIRYYLTRYMFMNAFTINVLTLLFYGSEGHGEDYYAATGHESTSDSSHRLLSAASSSSSSSDTAHDHLYINPFASEAIHVLIIIQAICALVTVSIFFMVQVPVRYSTEIESHKNPNHLYAFLYSILDPLTLWYIGYLFFTVLAYEVNPLFCSVLLLDWIVLDSTSQDLLLAISYPVKQLAATLIMIVIVINVFAFIIFVLFRHDVVTFNIHNLWETFKLCISYGFRGEYGPDHEMIPTIGQRMILDLAFYFVVLSILRHIFFAIIVDTFGKLREIKYEKDNEAKNTCFICGIERHDYDRMYLGSSSSSSSSTSSAISVGAGGLGGNGGNGFSSSSSSNGEMTFNDHRIISHNPLYYLYFIMSIWNQSQSQDTSLEMHVRNCLKNDDVHWLPTEVFHEGYHSNLAIAERIDMMDDGAENEALLKHEMERKIGNHGEGGHGGGGGGHGKGGHGGHSGGSSSSHHGGSKGGHHGSPSMITPSNRFSMIRGRSGSFLRRQPTGLYDDPIMKELMDKMNQMQKQLVKLSKEVSTNAVPGTTTIPTIDAIPSPSMLHTSPQIGHGGKTPIPTMKRESSNLTYYSSEENEDDSSSSSSDSDSGSDEDNSGSDKDSDNDKAKISEKKVIESAIKEDDEEKEEDEDDDDDSTSKPKSPISKLPTIVETSGSSNRSTLDSTTMKKSSLKEDQDSLFLSSPSPSPVKGRSTMESKVGGGSDAGSGSQVRISKRISHRKEANELKEKVSSLDLTLQLIMKKLESMESSFKQPPPQQQEKQLPSSPFFQQQQHLPESEEEIEDGAETETDAEKQQDSPIRIKTGEGKTEEKGEETKKEKSHRHHHRKLKQHKHKELMRPLPLPTSSSHPYPMMNIPNLFAGTPTKNVESTTTNVAFSGPPTHAIPSEILKALTSPSMRAGKIKSSKSDKAIKPTKSSDNNDDDNNNN